MIFDVCDMFFFLFSLSSIGEGAVIVAGFGSRRSRRILVGRLSFFVGVCPGEGHVAERRKEGKRKRSLSTYQSLDTHSLPLIASVSELPPLSYSKK